MPPSLLLSTRNPHKLREFARLLAPAGIAVEPLPESVELPPEVGETFVDNALPKARAAATGTGRVAIADDSGIEAEALGGRPGVRSARYAGEHASDAENLAKLLAEAPPGSALRYVCALAWVDPASGDEHVEIGECRGTLAARVAGTGGFGYDPAFIPESEGRRGGLGGDPTPAVRTMAELSDEEKDAISHRGNAVRALLRWLSTREA
ncbi:MAG TPA: non-canonical purine NTP pyrophosphatase [Solirubrobacteraceae bacterium]|nr:non-canonical purine NTP pyrophosphatase [Solirubrobacteraceae bacterium]